MSENNVSVSNLINENLEPIDLLELKKDNIYAIGDIFDEDYDTLYKFIEETEDDMYNKTYHFLNMNTGQVENIQGYILNDAGVYDITEPYNSILNRRKLEITRQKFGKDIASNIGEHLGVSIDDIREMYRRGGRRIKSRKFRVKSRRYKSRKSRVKSRRYKTRKSHLHNSKSKRYRRKSMR